MIVTDPCVVTLYGHNSIEILGHFVRFLPGHVTDTYTIILFTYP